MDYSNLIKKLDKNEPDAKPRPKKATMRLAAVCCSEGFSMSWGAFIMHMQLRYPLDSEKMAIKRM